MGFMECIDAAVLLTLDKQARAELTIWQRIMGTFAILTFCTLAIGTFWVAGIILTTTLN
jgi:hypothetical protein